MCNMVGETNSSEGQLLRKCALSSFVPHVLFNPMNDFCRDGDGPIVIFPRHRLREAGIARLHGKASQSSRFRDRCRNVLTALLKHRDQLCQIMHEGKCAATKQQQSFDCLFGGLLRIKAEIFKVDAGKVDVGFGP